MPLDVAGIVQRLLPGANYGSARGRNTTEQYAELRRTWRDARPLPTLTAINAAQAAADTDQAAIDADPAVDELLVALLAVVAANPTITALRNRRSAADAARVRAGQPR